PGSAVRHGHFVTVWRREPAGWRFAVDLGIRNPAPESPEPQWRAGASHAPQAAADFPAAVLQDLLLNTDRGFGERVRDAGVAVALTTFADDAVRVLRPGALPGVGKAAGGALYSAEARRYSAEPIQAVVSRSGDFGYTYGSYRWADASGNGRSESGHYVRIWTRSPGGPFRLLVDVVTPRPPEREE
ncbi:MAG TPA: hypothetical protein VEW03_01655, partial [Longimicrobiaceae bacterium]|nr:hypothetical protein [Longimicrobiaceae bacterium]